MSAVEASLMLTSPSESPVVVVVDAGRAAEAAAEDEDAAALGPLKVSSGGTGDAGAEAGTGDSGADLL